MRQEPQVGDDGIRDDDAAGADPAAQGFAPVHPQQQRERLRPGHQRRGLEREFLGQVATTVSAGLGKALRVPAPAFGARLHQRRFRSGTRR